MNISDYLFILWLIYLILGGYVVDMLEGYVSSDYAVMFWVISSYVLYICAWTVHDIIKNRMKKEQGYVNQRSR